jgi:nucleoside-diphosphate-sugar epimerase
MNSENLIVGSGLLARAFSRRYLNYGNVCIYAAGVSNSFCNDSNEFLRERQRLVQSLEQTAEFGTFVYFGTCSIDDPEAKNTPYVRHKFEMEKLVSKHQNYLILRLPQVAGITPNPHTLLNYLYARIARSEAFSLWSKAKRNIIDVDDIASIADQLIIDVGTRNRVFNIANVVNYSMIEIVSIMEQVVGKSAMYQIEERGAEYHINIVDTLSAINKAKVSFGELYLTKVLEKYYGQHN